MNIYSIKEELYNSAIRQKHKHGLDDEQCGIKSLNELFETYGENQAHLNELFNDKLQELEKRLDEVDFLLGR